MDVFPIPPGPIRATGVRFLARPTIFSIKSLRPKQALGAGGGDSPGTLDASVRCRIHSDQVRRPGLILGNSKHMFCDGYVCRLPTELYHHLLPDISPWYDGCRRPWYECSRHLSQAQKLRPGFSLRRDEYQERLRARFSAAGTAILRVH